MPTPLQNPDPLEALVDAIEKRARALFDDSDHPYPEGLRIALKFTHSLGMVNLDTLMGLEDVWFLHDVECIGRHFDFEKRQFKSAMLMPKCATGDRGIPA